MNWNNRTRRLRNEALGMGRLDEFASSTVNRSQSGMALQAGMCGRVEQVAVLCMARY
jgi:hypothetical protein